LTDIVIFVRMLKMRARLDDGKNLLAFHEMRLIGPVYYNYPCVFHFYRDSKYTIYYKRIFM